MVEPRQLFCPCWGSSVWCTDGCGGMTVCLCIHHQYILVVSTKTYKEATVYRQRRLMSITRGEILEWLITLFGLLILPVISLSSISLHGCGTCLSPLHWLAQLQQHQGKLTLNPGRYVSSSSSWSKRKYHKWVDPGGRLKVTAIRLAKACLSWTSEGSA